MRKSLLLLSFLFTCSLAFAQPSNDECATAISLGVAPNCPNTTVYTNEDATASVVTSDNNTPVCFTTIPDRDVWFTFTVPADGSVVDFTMQLFSFNDNGNGIQNPQIAIYRIDGGCDELAEFDCVSTPDGSTQLTYDLEGLTPGEIYYLRVNDYSATATPNAGEFTLCIGEFNPNRIICTDSEGASCFGTLFDSGGPDGDYMANENCTFTICPNDFNECLQIEIVDYNIENNADFLTFYAGDDTNANVISTLTGAGSGNPFQIETSADCITIEFTSDGGVENEGFELNWTCSSFECNSSVNDITNINGLPYDVDDLTTCDNSATYQETACGVLPFMAGPEAVFAYTADGTDDACYSVQVSGAVAGTGVLILDGLPTDPTASCVATGANGFIPSVSFDMAQTYYIVVANGDGCTDFDLTIQESTCVLDPSLEAALCNPLNGCVNEDGLPSVFNFNTEFFVDVEIVDGVNDGCWGGIGQGNFYWFTIQSAEDGPFGFTFQAADPAEASDIDFNVWGPYTNEQVCGNPEEVINLIETTLPFASSYAGGTEPTGLAEIHPTTGTVQDEFYDCDGVGDTNNDDYVNAIPTVEGQVWVVLVNDWGGNILSGQVQVDFSPSGEGVLDPIDELVEIDVEAAEVCQGVPVQLGIESTSPNIEWSPAESLSCSDCPNPIATPTETTEYTVTIDGVCVDAFGTATVNVYNADAGPDQTVCLGEEVQIVAGQIYAAATYSWEGPAGTLSCTDCAEPIITAQTAGVYEYTVTLNAPGCEIVDAMTLTVFPQGAAVYVVADDAQLCEGESYELGGAGFSTTQYEWTSVPAGFTSNEANPTVTPTETTMYYLSAVNEDSGCPFASMDSVFVEVFEPVTTSVEPDISICQGDTLLLSSLEAEEGVSYSWSPTTGIIGDPTMPSVMAVPGATTAYTLTATRGVCEDQSTINVEVNAIFLEINSPAEDTGICIGEEVQIEATALPTDVEVTWAPTAGLNPTTGTSLTASPTVPTEYIAMISVPGCTRMDTLFIDVDSLPVDMTIMPQDTTVCQGEIVILTSPIYEPGDYPEITHQWSPNVGFESGDSLYNMVITADETTTYTRETTVGFCEQTDEVTVNVIVVEELVVTPENPVVCPGDEVQLEVSAGNNTGITGYTWTPAEGLSCSDCPNPVATLQGTTTFTVVGENGSECPPSGMVTIEIIDFNPDLPQSVSFCDPGQINLNTADIQDGASYSWTSTDGSFTSEQPNPTFDLQETTSFTYTIALAGSSCEVSGEITMSLASTSSVTIEGEDVLCAGETTTLTAITPSGDGDFLWSTGAETSSIEVDASGIYTVTYVPNPEQCPENEFLAEFQVTVFDFPVIDSITIIGAEDCVAEEQLFDLTVFSTTTEGTYVWSDNMGNEFTSNNPTISINAPDLFSDEETSDTTFAYNYFLTLTNEGGCAVMDTTEVCIYSSLFGVPNVFTPNGDGVNDTFAPIIGEAQTLETFQVFNRWGQKVFDAEESGEDAWDGMYEDKPAPADVYVYVIQVIGADGEADETEKGDITLVR